MNFFAHTHESQAQPGDKWQLLNEHLLAVARLAQGRGEMIEEGFPQLSIAARWAGLLHDLGKYRPEFQAMLRSQRQKGEATRHKQAGAAWAYTARHFDIATAIAGHHGGMPDCSALKTEIVEAPGGRDVAAKVRNDAIREIPELAVPLPTSLQHTGALEFDLRTRMLFSCLVDADWSDTGAHERRADGFVPLPDARPLTPSLTEILLARVLSYIESRAVACRHSDSMSDPLASSITPDRHVPTIRAEILDASRAYAELPPGLFSMTVPTGGGKTLASLAFALKHTLKHKLRRIIYVAPYLSILEQNAREIRRALGAEQDSPDADLLFEHHSLAEPPGGKDLDEAESESWARKAQAWGAPFVVTTNVQFFESLFSNQPGQCRKLHNIARSVVILDECQTLPPGLIEPTCSMLQGLAELAGTTIVLCTATQPAWSKRKGWNHGLENVREIVPTELRLFERLRRVTVDWRRDKPSLNWSQVAEHMMNESAALCIVNTKKAAKAIFDELRQRTDTSAFHLSTSMCPAHRLAVIDEVRRRLQNRERCHLISTQLIEAGVDVDFPLVMREFAPLEAIVQSAGRCNREGRMHNSDGSPAGRVVVFRSVEGKLPLGDGWYLAGRDVVEAAFLNDGREPDIGTPEHMQEYFLRLYGVGSLDEVTPHQRRLDARGIQALRHTQRFATIWHGDGNTIASRQGRYRLIDDDTFPVIVGSWKSKADEVQMLLNQLRKSPGPRVYRELSRYQLNLRHHEKFTHAQFLSRESADVLVWRGRYDEHTGLIPEFDDLDFVV